MLYYITTSCIAVSTKKEEKENPPSISRKLFQIFLLFAFLRKKSEMVKETAGVYVSEGMKWMVSGHGKRKRERKEGEWEKM